MGWAILDGCKVREVMLTFQCLALAQVHVVSTLQEARAKAAHKTLKITIVGIKVEFRHDAEGDTRGNKGFSAVRSI